MTNIYRMNDYDWMAADSPGEATESYVAHYDGDPESCNPVLLDDHEMDKENFFDWDNQFGGGYEKCYSTRDALARMLAAGQTPPFFFASTEC